MLTRLLHEFADYDAWANARFVERLWREPDAMLDAPTPSSFPTLRKTLLHIRDAENAWTQRLLGEPVRWPAADGVGLDTVLPITERFVQLVKSYDEAELRSERVYHDLKGNRHASPAWRMILHALNHGTQHRGQLITMMRALGLDGIPANDLVVFQRSLVQG